MTERRTALVIGASRGLGLALAETWLDRGWDVIATVRGPSAALAAAGDRFPGRLTIAPDVDVDKIETVRALHRRLLGRSLDVLFVNAGIARDITASPLTGDQAGFLEMMLTNALAPVRAVEVLEGLVVPTGVIALMSSELGSLAQSTGYWQLYSASKAALNMLMTGFAAKHPGDPRAMILVAPGWVRTDMGGSQATFTIEESIPLVVDMIEANRGQPGLRFLDRFNTPLPW